MSKLLGNKVSEEICRVLGLDSSNIAKLDILLHAVEANREKIIDLLKKSGSKGITITEG